MELTDKNNVAIDITEIVNGKVTTEECEQVITEKVKFTATHNDNKYYIDCYYIGDYEGDYNSDTYAINVYDNYESFKNNEDNEHKIAEMYIFSDGSSIIDEGLYLKDKVVEEAIMEVLFNKDKPLIVAF